MIIQGTELLKIARKERPEVKYAIDREQASIAAKVGENWIRVACKTLSNPDVENWVSLPVEILINGQRMPFNPHPDF